jgi:hypothetical protein
VNRVTDALNTESFLRADWYWYSVTCAWQDSETPGT